MITKLKQCSPNSLICQIKMVTKTKTLH